MRLMTADRPVLGILLMLCFCVLAPVADAVAKVLGETVPVFQMLVVRFLFQVVLLYPVARLTTEKKTAPNKDMFDKTKETIRPVKRHRF